MQIQQKKIIKVNQNSFLEKDDLLVWEEPMEIRLEYGKVDFRQEKSLSVTMRTPDNDFELALGFLFSEGIIQNYGQVINIFHCPNVEKETEKNNVVKVQLAPDLDFDFGKLERHFYSTSSCGVCGKSSIEAIEVHCPTKLPTTFSVSPNTIHALSDLVKKEQTVFKFTGGLHAAAIFDTQSQLILWREDIGRHNALDKVIGSQVFKNQTPLSNKILWLSSRISFEMVQKSILAGISMVVAMGAASSLAVDLAEQYNLTLIGFSRNQSFNIYTGSERIKQ